MSDSWTPQPWWASVAGAATIGVVVTGMTVGLAWLARYLPGGTAWSLEELSNAALLSWVLTTAVTVVVGRCFAARARHNAPGGVVNIGLEVLLCGAVAGIAGHLTLPGLHPGLVYGLAAFVAHAGFAVAMKEWEPGMTSDEFDATMAEFRAMTKEHFAEDVENVRQGARARLRADWEKKQARRDR